MHLEDSLDSKSLLRKSKPEAEKQEIKDRPVNLLILLWFSGYRKILHIINLDLMEETNKYCLKIHFVCKSKWRAFFLLQIKKCKLLIKLQAYGYPVFWKQFLLRLYLLPIFIYYLHSLLKLFCW